MLRWIPLLSVVSPVACHAEAAPEAPASFSEVEMRMLDGRPFESAAVKDKVVLFVNVASKCGFTPQYEGLKKLYNEKKDEGLVIVGVPCNQFGWQEPGDAEQIQEFCKMNYGVTFPILEKQDVNGAERSELYSYLVNSSVGGGSKVKWNFEKFLVGRSGKVLSRYGSRTAPGDSDLRAAIDKALSAK